uniref:HintN domain-containing protein n=1 Tax=Heterorhabditis bacteriophora TaxID=37862 RepID=A0A1I7XQ62_HETBA
MSFTMMLYMNDAGSSTESLDKVNKNDTIMAITATTTKQTTTFKHSPNLSVVTTISNTSKQFIPTITTIRTEPGTPIFPTTTQATKILALNTVTAIRATSSESTTNITPTISNKLTTTIPYALSTRGTNMIMQTMTEDITRHTTTPKFSSIIMNVLLTTTKAMKAITIEMSIPHPTIFTASTTVPGTLVQLTTSSPTAATPIKVLRIPSSVSTPLVMDYITKLAAVTYPQQKIQKSHKGSMVDLTEGYSNDKNSFSEDDDDTDDNDDDDDDDSDFLLFLIVTLVAVLLGSSAGGVFVLIRKKKVNNSTADNGVLKGICVTQIAEDKGNVGKGILVKNLVRVKQMEAATIDPREFHYKGPLVLDTGLKGDVRHALENDKSSSLKNIEFDNKHNEIVDIGSDIEFLDASHRTTVIVDPGDTLLASNTSNPSILKEIESSIHLISAYDDSFILHQSSSVIHAICFYIKIHASNISYSPQSPTTSELVVASSLWSNEEKILLCFMLVIVCGKLKEYNKFSSYL